MASKRHSVEVVVGAVDNASSQIGDISGSLKVLAGAGVLGAVTKAAGLAKDAIGFLADKMVEAVEAANVQDAAERDLAVALKLSGNASDGAAERIAQYAAKLQTVSTVGDEASIKLAALAVNFGANEEQAKTMTRAAVDMAAALGISTQTAMRGLGQALKGNVETLGRYIPELKDLTDEQKRNGDAVGIVADRYRGAASDALTFQDRVTQITNILGDSSEELGKSITRSAAFNGVLEAIRDTLVEISGMSNIGTIIGDSLAVAAFAIADTMRRALGWIAEAQRKTADIFAMLAKIPLAGNSFGNLALMASNAAGANAKIVALLKSFEKKAIANTAGRGGVGQTLTFGGKGQGTGGGFGGGAAGGGTGGDLTDAVQALFKMGQQLKALNDPAERIRQKFAAMRAEVAAMGPLGDTPLGKNVLAQIDAAEQSAIDKIKKPIAKAAEQVKTDNGIAQQWENAGLSAAASFAAGLGAAMSGKGNVGKALLKSLLGFAATAASILGGPAGAALGLGTSFIGGLIQHTGSMGYIPTAHSGLLASSETMIRAQRGEAILSRQAVDRIGGPGAVASINSGLGGGGGLTVQISAIDSQSLDSAIRRGSLGRKLAEAIRMGAGPLAGVV